MATHAEQGSKTIALIMLLEHITTMQSYLIAAMDLLNWIGLLREITKTSFTEKGEDVMRIELFVVLAFAIACGGGVQEATKEPKSRFTAVEIGRAHV